MPKPPSVWLSNIRVLDAFVWLWLLGSLIGATTGQWPWGMDTAILGGALLLLVSLWAYRKTGGTWPRLVTGLGFLFGMIFIAVQW